MVQLVDVAGRDLQVEAGGLRHARRRRGRELWHDADALTRPPWIWPSAPELVQRVGDPGRLGLVRGVDVVQAVVPLHAAAGNQEDTRADICSQRELLRLP